MPVIVVFLSGPSVEVARGCRIVHHGQMKQPRTREREILHKDGEIRYLVTVNPQDSQVGEGRKPGVRV